MTPHEELVHELRAALAFGLVLAVYDAGAEQLVDVQVLPGVVRSGVRVVQPFGFASAPVVDGAMVLLGQVGGDAANLVAWPVARPGGRFGGLAAGETVIYGAAGQRVALRADGSVEVLSATEIRISTASDVHITAPQVTITGTLTVTGEIYDLNAVHGALSALRSDYNAHTHSDPQGGSTGGPSAVTP